MTADETFAMEEEDAAALLLSDQLMDEDDESEIYEMVDEEEDDDVVIAATSQPKYSDELDSFYLEDDEDEEGEDLEEGLVQENPFEPVYPATAAGLLFENDSDSSSNVAKSQEKGIVLEAVSLDNILPAGSRRRRN